MTFEEAKFLLGTQLETNMSSVEFLSEEYFAGLASDDDIPVE